MSTKIDIINEAYSRARISGLTKLPSPEDIAIALRRLEGMASRWGDKNYAFEDDPDPGTPHNIPREDWDAYESNLAVSMLSNFGKDGHPGLVKEARGTKAHYDSRHAQTGIVPYPSRQPIGSGNTLGRYRWRRFYSPTDSAPTSPDTIEMITEEVNIFTAHFDEILRYLEAISTYTIESDDTTNLALSGDSLTSPDVTYTATANKAGVYQVTIKATTTLNRFFVKKTNFVVRD